MIWFWIACRNDKQRQTQVLPGLYHLPDAWEFLFLQEMGEQWFVFMWVESRELNLEEGRGEHRSVGCYDPNELIHS